MSEYMIAVGHDNEAGLALLVPQPACEGMMPAVLNTVANGDVSENGAPWLEWRYAPELIEARYASVLAQCGLTSYWSREVTIRTIVSADRGAYANFNATIVKPVARYRMGYYRETVFLVKKLVAL